MRVFRYCGLQERCNEEYFPDDTHLLADSASSLQTRVMVPYRDNGHLGVEERYFNRILSAARMLIERAIGLLKMRWRILLDRQPMTKTILIPFYILACCILHNICIQRNDEFDYSVIIPNTIDEDDDPREVPVDERNAEILKRDHLRNVVSG